MGQVPCSCADPGLAVLNLADACALGRFSVKPIRPKGCETEKELGPTVSGSVRKSPLRTGLSAGQTVRTLDPGSRRQRATPWGRRWAALIHGPYLSWDEGTYSRLQPGVNVVAFEVAAITSTVTAGSAVIPQAEIVADGKVLASTDGHGVPSAASTLQEQVERGSAIVQAPLSEVYRLAQGFDRWRVDATSTPVEVKCSVQPVKALLSRRVDYPDYVVRQPSWSSQGEVRTGSRWTTHGTRSLADIGPKLAVTRRKNWRRSLP